MQNKLMRGPILLILDTPHGQIGGTEQNTLRFAQALLHKGYNPIVVEVGDTILSKNTDLFGLKLENLPSTNFGEIDLKSWKTRLQKCKPYVVIRSKTWIDCINYRLDIAALTSGFRHLIWEHHPSTPRESKKIDVIYPGVDFSFFKYNENARARLRLEWGIPQGALVIGWLGRLVPHKGNDLILKVIAEILRQHPTLDMWCVIAGKGPDLPHLETIAKNLGIHERVIFAGWQENAANAWSAIDVFLMPSSEEGLGMTTLIEAAASGCIPIATKVGGMQEILCGQLEEYLCKTNHIDERATLTSKLLSASARAKRQRIINQNIRNRFDENTQWGLMVNWLENHS